MKKILLLFLLVMIFLSSKSQNLTVTVPTVTATIGQTVSIPVKLSGASSTGIPISSANIQITYDSAVLEYDTLANFYTGTPVNQWYFSGHDGLVSANWLEPNLLTLPIPDNTTLYEIVFTYKGGNSPLIFVVYEFTDAIYELIPTTPVHGAVNGLTRQVTLKVDMSKETVSPNGVHLAGSFNNWNYNATPMTLLSAGVYTTTLTLNEGSTYQYRFVNGNSMLDVETVPPGCGVLNGNGEYDRQLVVPDHDTLFDAVCFSMCSHCPFTFPMTFRVDMQHQSVSPDGVHIAGSFNNWNYSQTPLTLSSGSVYEVVLTLDEGSYLEYKFVNGNTALQAENVPSACAVNGNRYFTVPSHDSTLTAVCYDSCVACGAVLIYSDVTFRVDLMGETVSPDGVHVAGTFQGWDPAATAMVNGGDDTFTYTVSLLTNTSVEYRFVNGNTTAGYEIVPFQCSSNGNRTLLVPQVDTVLTLVCFAECDTCAPDGYKELKSNGIGLDQNYPNPCYDNTTIGFSTDRSGMLKLSLYGPMGQLIKVLFEGKSEPGDQHITVETSTLPSGIYTYQLLFSDGINNQQVNKKLQVK